MKAPQRQPSSLSAVRSVIGEAPALLRTGWPLLALLSISPAVAYVWRGVAFGDWRWSIMGLLICSAFALVVWHGLLARTTRLNRHVFHRSGHPVRYWITLTLWFVGYLTSVAAFFFADSQIHR